MRGSAIAREVLLELDTWLAIVTSGSEDDSTIARTAPSKHPPPPEFPDLECLPFGWVCELTDEGLLTFSSLISEDLCLFLDFPSDRSIFSTFVGGYKSTAIAEKREENPAWGGAL